MLYSINWPGYCHMLQVSKIEPRKGDITYSMVKEEGPNCERIFLIAHYLTGTDGMVALSCGS